MLTASPTVTDMGRPGAWSVEPDLPLGSMVRALCRAAMSGPDLLYEVILKATLAIDATARTYGLSTWVQKAGERARLKWVEGLDEDELLEAEAAVNAALSRPDEPPRISPGDRSLCFVLATASIEQEGAAIYGRCVRPLDDKQAATLSILSDLAHLTHAHVALRGAGKRVQKTASAPSNSSVKLPGMISTSRSMAAVAASVERIKDSASAVLITGESGTGKELVARAIHRLGKRASGEFIPFNCTAAPADLIESMLFGHRKGAFTGAHQDYPGLIRSAEGGTLFLDEIGDLPLALQPKLLRFLQEGEVHTLGERAPRKVNVRVVAATHKDLKRAVAEGGFREDLYYRVAALSIHIPPLRERPDDTAALISHFLTHYTRRNDREVAGITLEAIAGLQSYAWPGNVRELAAEIERLVLYADQGSYIGVEHLSPRILPAQTGPARAAQESPAHLDHLLADFERRVITETLKRHDCNVARASEALGLGSRQTLYKKLKRLAIDVGDFLQEEQEPGLQLRADVH